MTSTLEKKVDETSVVYTRDGRPLKVTKSPYTFEEWLAIMEHENPGWRAALPSVDEFLAWKRREVEAGRM